MKLLTQLMISVILLEKEETHKMAEANKALHILDINSTKKSFPKSS
jgi:hypothetical protein